MLIMPLFSTGFESVIFSSVIALWVLVEIINGGIIPLLRHSSRTVIRKDNRSTFSNYLLRVSLFGSIIIAIVLVIQNIAMLPDWFFLVGIVIIVIGIIMRQWAMLVLGRYFTITVSVHKNQKVVDYGPYRYIRHPSYLGISLIAIGIGVALGSWVGILVILLMYGSTIWYRMHIEEKLLVSELGDDYIRYMKRTKRLMPFIL
jgi:protein-S-isoprenylcysteine O-methyltransferase Ste14